MRVSILTQVFPPEIHPTAIMVDQLARYLADAGHEVLVAAGFPHHPHGRLIGGRSRRLLQEERRDGFVIRRGFHALSESRGIAARAGVMASQAVGTAMAALTAPGPDVVVSYGPPLVGPALAAVVARVHRAPLMTVVYDIYPDVAIETGKVRNPAIVSVARLAERLVYRASDRILVLSGGFERTLVAKGVPPEKIVVLPVWLEPDEIQPRDRNNAWRAEHHIPREAKVVLYAGTVGLVSGAEVMIETAAEFRSRDDVLFLFVGDGQLRPELERLAGSRGLRNVRFLPFQPRERLADVQASADVSVVTLAPGRGRTSVPSKVIAYFAAGRPVVASVDQESDTAECIHRSGAGIVTAPGDSRALSAALETLLSHPEERARMGLAGRRHFLAEYSAPALLIRYGAILEGLVRRGA